MTQKVNLPRQEIGLIGTKIREVKLELDDLLKKFADTQQYELVRKILDCLEKLNDSTNRINWLLNKERD